MSFIEIDNISKTFETKDKTVEALRNISIHIDKGDIYGIIGMSGAGKSTLVRCINLLEQPDTGEVRIAGHNLKDFSKKELRVQREKIGMIFQHFNLLMQKNVLENVCFPLYIQKVSKKEAVKKAMELLELVGLSDRAHAFPAQLSGGQKQRVAIARALASDPEILLCDEATSALDPKTTASILELLKRINEQFGITIVIITHQMSVVQKICSHVAILQNGEVAEVGTVEDVFNHPKSKTARDLILRDIESEHTALEAEESIQGGTIIRVVFSENSAFEPVISNLILNFREPVNILKASTKNVGGLAKGEMILEFRQESTQVEKMKAYLVEKGLFVEEVSADVDGSSH